MLDVYNHAEFVDEGDIQWDERVAHPKRKNLLSRKDKQHALIVRQIFSEHQPESGGLLRLGNFHLQRHVVNQNSVQPGSLRFLLLICLLRFLAGRKDRRYQQSGKNAAYKSLGIHWEINYNQTNITQKFRISTNSYMAFRAYRIPAIPIFLLLLLNSPVRSEQNGGANQVFTTHETTTRSIVFSINSFDLKLASVEVDGQKFLDVSASDFGRTTESGFPSLPTATALINIPPDAEVSVRILESSFEEIPDIDPLPAPTIAEDLQKDAVAYSFKKDEAFYTSDTCWPSELAVFAGEGSIRGQRVGRIQVQPVQYNPVRKTLRVYKSLKIAVEFSQPFAQNIPLNPPSKREAHISEKSIFETLAGTQYINPEYHSATRPTLSRIGFAQNDWYNPQFTYYKLFVEEEGIYSLTYGDLLAAGIEAANLNLETLKIYNRGELIPLWVTGPQSLTFSPQDTIFFYADWHRGRDRYYDFYTDTNVYFLTDDGEPGPRYREILSDSPPVIPEPFYWETLHIEREVLCHRSNSSSEIDPDEGWIGRYIFDNEHDIFNFDLSGLHYAVEQCTLNLRLQGTTQDPVNPDHHVRLSVNNQLVGDNFFDDREELLWNLVLPTSLFINGQNRFDLQLVGDTGTLVNQIYLDWVDVIYPRTPATTQNNFKFIADNPSRVIKNYFLHNFQDPTITIFDPQHGRLFKPQIERASFFQVESAGLNDGNFVKLIAHFEVQEFRARGHHLMTIDPQTGATETRRFDFYSTPPVADELAAYLNSLPEGRLVLAGICDEGSVNINEAVYQAFESAGSSLIRQVGFRDGLAFIGRKGAPIGSAKEVLSKSLSGPAVASDTLRNESALRYSASFTDTSSSNFYYAASKSGIKKVGSIEKDKPSDLHATTNAADYLLITHKNFEGEAQRLADYRSDQNGFRTAVVDVEDVYDEFNCGIIAPEAIKSFLSYAYQFWQQPAPSYLVLLGDASWDPKKLSAGAVKTNYVPSFGILVADNWYALLDGTGDVLPDLFVGRIPVETAEQAAIVIDKIMAYERLPFDSWNKEIAFANGGINATEQIIFLSQANRLIDDYVNPAPFSGLPIRYNKTTAEAVTQNFRRTAADQIQNGVSWFNFIGHAGSQVWDVDIGNPDEWQNRELFPFVSGMSCHSARFAEPVLSSLSEEFVIHPNGAAAYWGSAGFGYITQDFFLLDGLFRAVTKDTVRSVGAATTSAKYQLWQRLGDQPRSQFVIDQYTLIGDPAMELNIPTKPELSIRSDDIVLSKDLLLTTDSTAIVSGRLRNFGLQPTDSAIVRISVLDSENRSTLLGQFILPPIGFVDSVAATWNLPNEPGEYRIQVEIDPQNQIAEDVEDNNLAERTVTVFSSDLTLVKPLDFGVVQNDNAELVTNNSKIQIPGLVYFFETDTSAAFDSPLKLASPPIDEGRLATRWQPNLALASVYYWRVRTFDGENFGPWAAASFTYSSQTSGQWLQQSTEQFNKNHLENISTNHQAAALRQNQFYFLAESAGLNDGNFARLWRNDEHVSLNQRGHNLAVFDGTDGALLDRVSFDTYGSSANAEALAQFINALPDGRVVLAAIRDDGSVSMTESAYLALESIGSQFTRQVQFRDAWAIIGQKGAAIGTAPEEFKKAGAGAIAITDTLYRFAKTGSIVSTAIGPAREWKSAQLAFQTNPQDQIKFSVIGKQRASGVMDTLISNITTGEIDLSQISALTYPQLMLTAAFSSGAGLTTPLLQSWTVDFSPSADLATGKSEISVQQDTVEVGAEVQVTIGAANFGLSPADSFFVSIHRGPNELQKTKVTGLPVDEIREYPAFISTSGLSGKIDLTVRLDADDRIVELDENNNAADFSIWVVRDTLAPSIRVQMDGRTVALEDFVSATPQVVVEIRDHGPAAFTDTSQVSVLLDEQKITYGNGAGQAQFLPQSNPEQRDLKALTIFTANLSEADHQIEVFARDESGNLNYFEQEFQVSSRFRLTEVLNYPNPFQNETAFTYILTQDADEVRLKIYTVAGRLIHEADFLPARVGFNQFQWNARDFDGDTLANGVYLYKLIARKDGEQVEVVEKLVVMR